MRRMLAVCLAAALTPFGWAQQAEARPDQLLRAATLELAERIKQEGHRRASPLMQEPVEATVLRLFDVGHMTRIAMGHGWSLASSGQQEAILAGFRALLARTYAATLVYRPEQTIEFKAPRFAPGEAAATVRASLKLSGTETASVDYVMEKTALGWKIHDMRIAGISMLATYRSAFTEVVRARGVEGLLHGLSAANRQAQATDRSDESGTRNALFSYSILTSLVRGSR